MIVLLSTGDVAEHWLNVMATLGISCFFSIERIAGLDRLSRMQDFAVRAAHDIRSPIMALEMVSSSLKDENDPRKVIIQTAVQRINYIANDMLKEKLPRKTQEIMNGCSVNGLIRNFVAERSMTSKIPIEFSPQDPMAEVIVGVKPCDLYRVLSNLVNNAIEAIAENDHGIVRVSTSKIVDRIIICVHDNGRGISAQNQNRIFQKGFSFGKLNGHGLGLYGSREIVKNYGGEISVSSIEGLGTTVSVQIPTMANQFGNSKRQLISVAT